jgi:poly(A) polymerase
VSELNATQQRALAELLRLTPVIGELGARFRDAGHQLYLVGGSVRDALLGRLGNDLDFTTSAKPDETQALLQRYTKAIWDIGKEWGTIGARKKDPKGGDWLIEITTFRADTYRSDSRKPTVVYGDNIEGDLLRRDFTINAMAIDVSHPSGTPQLVDPYDGLDDLADHLIRTPSTPELSFSDDPLRMMRAARFASQLLFELTSDVRAAMRSMAERITIISAERVQGELTKLLLSDDPALGLDLLVSTGLAAYVLPELPALQLERDEHAMHKDIYAHTLTVLQQAIELEKRRGHSPDLINRLAALLHDIGKPATKRVEGGKVSFLYHDIVGAKLVRKRLKALKYPNEIVDAVSQLVEQHLRFHGYGEQEWTDSAVRRYVHDAGPQLERLHMLTRADCTTRNAAKATRLRRAYDELEFRIDELKKQEELDAIRPDLDGAQIMALLGIKPGPVVGEAYRFLLERRMTDGPLGPQRAKDELLAWWASRS